MFDKISRLPLPAHILVAVAATVAFNLVMRHLDASYAASMHPVDYATGQLAFDAQRIEGYYAAMIKAGTLDVYWRTQVIDFGFIASVMAVSVFFGTLAARFSTQDNRIGGWGRRLGLGAAILGVAGAGFDALENLLSFGMLLRPETIAQPLAFAYSASAAIKFALLTAAMAALLLSLIAGGLAWIGRKRSAKGQ